MDYKITEKEYQYLRKFIKHELVSQSFIKIPQQALDRLSIKGLIKATVSKTPDKITFLYKVTDFGEICYKEYRKEVVSIRTAKRANIISAIAVVIALGALIVAILAFIHKVS